MISFIPFQAAGDTLLPILFIQLQKSVPDGIISKNTLLV